MQNKAQTSLANELKNTKRNLKEKNHRNENGWPEWLSVADRRLLQSPSLTPHVVVAADGSGNYTTVSAAVAAAPTCCLTEIGVPVTKELGFHQVDIRGDPYGLLAAHPLAPLVSLHHLDYVRPIFPRLTRIDSVKKLIAAYKMDPGRTLQQSLCYDLTGNWSVSASWGYTIQIYPALVTAKKLETAFKTFQTWRTWSNGPFTFNTRPMSHHPCLRPAVYFLDRVERAGDGALTTYKRSVEELDKVCDRPEYASVLAVQSVNIKTSTSLKPDIWNMAPRRQCCEIIHGDTGGNSVVEVNIRGCNRFESVTPP